MIPRGTRPGVRPGPNFRGPNPRPPRNSSGIDMFEVVIEIETQELQEFIITNGEIIDPKTAVVVGRLYYYS